jgi:hypothetical protein
MLFVDTICRPGKLFRIERRAATPTELTAGRTNVSSEQAQDQPLELAAGG